MTDIISIVKRCCFTEDLDGVRAIPIHELENAIDEDGLSALHAAVQAENIAVVEYVTRNCPQILNNKTRNGETALDLAMIDENRVEIAKVLLLAGAHEHREDLRAALTRACESILQDLAVEQAQVMRGIDRRQIRLDNLVNEQENAAYQQELLEDAISELNNFLNE